MSQYPGLASFLAEETAQQLDGEPSIRRERARQRRAALDHEQGPMAPLSGLHQYSLPSDFEACSEPATPLSMPMRPSAPVLAPLPMPLSTSVPLAASTSTRAPSSPTREPTGLDRRPSHELTPRRRPSRRRDVDDARGPSRRRKRTWKKLLWVKQSYPDNYTDQATFLENLQRNPRLQPYEFWPLVADSTVIVQHVCSVILFVVCFVGIFQERVSPVAVVSWGSFATFIGWGLWDWWVGQDVCADAGVGAGAGAETPAAALTTSRQLPLSVPPSTANSTSNLPLLTLEREPAGRPLPRQQSGLADGTSQAAGAAASKLAVPCPPSKHRPSSPLRGGRTNLRVNAMKSALLIYFTLLGLSPILKSLTRSTSSDSIWAMSLWLLVINIFFFDYSGAWVGVSNTWVPSLSTNAALMASTVLASRLPSTGQVFGLTLFSIEVFGLFPVFRRYARHRSWRYHVLLTVLLVLGAGGGVAMTLTGPSPGGCWPWRSGLLGMLLGCLVAAIAMGGCSWWLLGLQKYKNEIHGPWDPARPIIITRRHWDDG